MTNIDEATTEQLWWMVSMAKKDCLRCKGTGADNPVQPFGQEPHTCLCAIDPSGPGAGQVWALPGLQERCPGLSYADHEDSPPDCRFCHGLGFVPVKDLGVLLEAALSFLDENGYVVIGRTGKDGVALVGFPGKPQQEDRIWGAGEPRQALLRAVAQALVAQGAELGETP